MTIQRTQPNVAYPMLHRLLCELYGESGEGNTPNAGGEGDAEKTFTQSQVNNIVADRLKRDREIQKAGGELPAADAEELAVLRKAKAIKDEEDAAAAVKGEEERAEYDRIIERQKTQHETQMGERDATIAKMTETNEQAHKLATIQQAILPHSSSLMPNAGDILLMMFQNGTKIRPDDNNLYFVKTDTDPDTGVSQSFLVASDGNQPVNENLDDMTIADAVSIYLKNNPNLVEANPKTGSGSSGNNGANNADRLSQLHTQGKTTGKREDMHRYMQERRKQQDAQTP